MDFASLMSSSMAKAQGSSGNDDKPATSTKKYVSRREAEEQRKAAYLAEQAALEARRTARAAEKRKREEEAAEEAKAREDKRRRLAEESRQKREEKEAEEERQRRKRLGLPELPPDQEATPSEEEDGGAADSGITGEELTAKLRELGEPTTLFGEAHTTRLKRYRKLTTVVTTGPIPTTLQLVEEKDMKVSGVVPPASDKAGRRYLFRQLASYFTMVLSEWQIALAAEKARSGGGSSDPTAASRQRTAWNTMAQCVETMKPLFRKFEKGDMDDDVLRPVVEIVQAAQERRYVDANDGYLRLSIGKAAWPIGVTMVGIHERSAREKLHNGERGHVMGDEVTRKYLQSIKRCLTFAQVRWPPEDIRQLMG